MSESKLPAHLRPEVEKPKKGPAQYRDPTAEAAIGRADKVKREGRRKPLWGPEWRH